MKSIIDSIKRTVELQCDVGCSGYQEHGFRSCRECMFYDLKKHVDKNFTGKKRRHRK